MSQLFSGKDNRKDTIYFSVHPHFVDGWRGKLL